MLIYFDMVKKKIILHLKTKISTIVLFSGFFKEKRSLDNGSENTYLV